LSDALEKQVNSQTTIQTFADLLKEEKVKEFNKLREGWNGELKFINLDLSNLDFTGINFKSITFTGSNFTQTILDFANLEGITSSRVTENFRDAYISNADLSGADLTDTDLTGADLTDTDLTGADLTGTNPQMLTSPVPIWMMSPSS